MIDECGEKATAKRPSTAPSYFFFARREMGSNVRTTLSSPVAATSLPSGAKATARSGALDASMEPRGVPA